MVCLDVLPIGGTYTIGVSNLSAPSSTRRFLPSRIIFNEGGPQAPTSPDTIRRDLQNCFHLTPEITRRIRVDGQLPSSPPYPCYCNHWTPYAAPPPLQHGSSYSHPPHYLYPPSTTGPVTPFSTVVTPSSVGPIFSLSPSPLTSPQSTSASTLPTTIQSLLRDIPTTPLANPITLPTPVVSFPPSPSEPIPLALQLPDPVVVQSPAPLLSRSYTPDYQAISPPYTLDEVLEICIPPSPSVPPASPFVPSTSFLPWSPMSPVLSTSVPYFPPGPRVSGPSRRTPSSAVGRSAPYPARHSLPSLTQSSRPSASITALPVSPIGGPVLSGISSPSRPLDLRTTSPHPALLPFLPMPPSDDSNSPR